MIKPNQHPTIKPPWNLPVGVVESIVFYNCRVHGFPRPVLAMPMWEGAGSRAIDYSGYGNHGTLDVNYNYWTSENIGFISSVSTDGILCGTKSSLEIQENSLFCFAKLNNDSNQTLFAKERIVYDGFEYALRGSKLAYAYYDTGVRGWYTATNEIDVTVWNSYGCCWRQSDGEVDFYYNGSLDSSANTTTGVINHNSSREAQIGDRDFIYEDSLGGCIKCLYLFPVVLTAEQIRILHDDPYFMFRQPETIDVCTEAEVGWSGNVNTITSIAKINNVPVANISKVNGVS